MADADAMGSAGSAEPGDSSLPFTIALGTLVIVIVVSIVVLWQFFSTTATPAATVPIVPLPTVAVQAPPVGAVPTLAPINIPPGSPLAPDRIYGAGSNLAPLLSQPQEAVRGPKGLIFVADTGNHRVVVLDPTGHLVRSITNGPGTHLLSPFSLAMTPAGHLLVLDSDLGQVIEYDVRHGASDALVRASDRALSLVHARGIALDAAGDVLIANPAGNAVVTLRSDMTLLHQQPHIALDGTDLFDQPSAVAVGPDGSIYVVDSQNNRLVQFSSAWKLQRSWPLVASDTLHSPRVLPLSKGRVLATDPRDGKLLLYTPGSDQPRVYSLTAPGNVPPVPLGLAAAGSNGVLVTCNNANQVLKVRVPGP